MFNNTLARRTRIYMSFDFQTSEREDAYPNSFDFRDKKHRRANLSLKIKKPDKKVDQRAKSKSIHQILISSSSEIGQIDTFPSCERDIRESRAAV